MTQVGKMLKDEGKTEGRMEERMELAKEMLADGKPDEEILKYSKISEEMLDTLKKEQNRPAITLVLELRRVRLGRRFITTIKMNS